MSKTNWKTLLSAAMSRRGESLADLKSCTLTLAELMQEFDPGYGRVEGMPFTAWTTKTVYFPICYDGAESIGSVSRNPDNIPTLHQGG